MAQPDLYRVTLQNGLVAEMSPTDHAGIMRFTFPTGQATGSLVFHNGTLHHRHGRHVHRLGRQRQRPVGRS